jgi:hypothetical protein
LSPVLTSCGSVLSTFTLSYHAEVMEIWRDGWVQSEPFRFRLDQGTFTSRPDRL